LKEGKVKGKKSSAVQIGTKLRDERNREIFDFSKPVPEPGNPNHALV
jgi:hypothetical protein